MSRTIAALTCFVYAGAALRFCLFWASPKGHWRRLLNRCVIKRSTKSWSILRSPRFVATVPGRSVGCSTRPAAARGCANALVIGHAGTCVCARSRSRAARRACCNLCRLTGNTLTVHRAAHEEGEEEEGGGSAVVQKKKPIGPAGPLLASTVNKDKKKDDMQFSFESARSAVLTRIRPARKCARAACYLRLHARALCRMSHRPAHHPSACRTCRRRHPLASNNFIFFRSPQSVATIGPWHQSTKRESMAQPRQRMAHQVLCLQRGLTARKCTEARRATRN